MARSYRLEDRLARNAQKEFDAKERFRKAQNALKEAQGALRKANRMTAGRILDRDGFLDLPTEEFNAGLQLWGVIRELGLLKDAAEAERRLREPSGRSRQRKEDVVAAESVVEIAAAAE